MFVDQGLDDHVTAYGPGDLVVVLVNVQPTPRALP